MPYTTGESANFTAHDTTFSTSGRYGFLLNPNVDLDGIQVTLSTVIVGSNMTVGVAPTGTHNDIDTVSGVSAGDTVQLIGQLNSGTDYYVYVTDFSEVSFYDSDYSSPNYINDDFDIPDGYYYYSGTYYVEPDHLYNFDSATALFATAPNAPNDVTASVAANDQIDLSITPPDNFNESASNYRVQINRDGSGYESPSGGPTTPVGTNNSPSYGPASDSSYSSQVGIDSSFQFRVRAENSEGSSDWTYSGTVYTDPIPPHNPSVSRPDANTIEIHGEVQANHSSKIRVQIRRDDGSGYGPWENHDLVAESDEGLVSGSVETTGSNFTFSYTVGQTFSGGDNKLREDARHQIRLRTWNLPNGTDTKKSEWVYADYGNSGNVYFEDDFESGDLSAWDSNNLAGDAGVTSGSGPADLTISGADQGTYYFYGEGTSYTNATWIQKNLGDLSNESGVIVRCAFATASLDSSAEDFGMSWYDGSSWQSLQHLKWEYNQQGWFEVQAKVPNSYLSADTRVRVGTTTSSGMYSGDHFAVDRVVVSDVLHEYTTPAAPSSLSLDASTKREITATWTNNDAFADGVDVDYKPTSVSAWTDAGGSYRASETLTELLDGERYDIRVRPFVEQYRRGSLSSTFVSEIAGAVTTVLPAPIALGVGEVREREVDLFWTSNHNYGDVLVETKPADASEWATQETVDHSTEQQTVTGLRNGEQYDARVLASTEHTQTEDN